MLKAQMKNCRSPYLRGKGGSINWSKEFTQYIFLQSIMYICKPCSCNLHFCHKHFGNTVEKHQYPKCIPAGSVRCTDCVCHRDGACYPPQSLQHSKEGFGEYSSPTQCTPQLPPLCGAFSCCNNFLQNQKNFLRISLSFPGPIYALPFLEVDNQANANKNYKFIR